MLDFFRSVGDWGRTVYALNLLAILLMLLAAWGSYQSKIQYEQQFQEAVLATGFAVEMAAEVEIQKQILADATQRAERRCSGRDTQLALETN